MYTYKAIVRSVYDGDTIRVDISLGFGVWIFNEAIRLAGINAPEVRGEERELGLASRDFLRGLILEKEIVLRTVKSKSGSDTKGKYGRYLGWIKVEDESGETIEVNTYMVQQGHAIFKEY